MLRKNGQFSIEFMLIFVFIMSIVSIIILILGQISLEVGLEEKKNEVDDFAQSILKEFEIMQVVEGGYNRTFTIPNYFMERFNVTIDEYGLFVTDLDTYSSDVEFSRNYRIPGEFNFINSTNGGNLTITLFKPYVDEFEGISIQ